MTVHRSDADLMLWLESGHRTDDHILGCDVCTVRLEDLTSLDQSLLEAARSMTKPPEGLVERIDARMRSRGQLFEAIAAVGGLFSLGWRTIDTLWTNHE
ncbi:MAG: hypothetical protein KJO18_10640 [Acidimicrobiia bacterium]|nr:hypothetical protein [Acidimicrobiia bacterium]